MYILLRRLAERTHRLIVRCASSRFYLALLSISVLVDALSTMGVPLGNPTNQAHIDTIYSAPNQIEGDVLPPRIAAACKMLWADQGIKTVYMRKNEIQLNDSAK